MIFYIHISFFLRLPPSLSFSPAQSFSAFLRPSISLSLQWCALFFLFVCSFVCLLNSIFSLYACCRFFSQLSHCFCVILENHSPLYPLEMLIFLTTISCFRSIDNFVGSSSLRLLSFSEETFSLSIFFFFNTFLCCHDLLKHLADVFLSIFSSSRFVTVPFKLNIW